MTERYLWRKHILVYWSQVSSCLVLFCGRPLRRYRPSYLILPQAWEWTSALWGCWLVCLFWLLRFSLLLRFNLQKDWESSVFSFSFWSSLLLDLPFARSISVTTTIWKGIKLLSLIASGIPINMSGPSWFMEVFNHSSFTPAWLGCQPWPFKLGFLK